jgi:hypothetical protein
MHPVLMRQLAARRGMTPSGDQAQLPRPGDGLGTVGCAEFAQDVADVLVDGIEGDGRNGTTPEPSGVEGPLGRDAPAEQHGHWRALVGEDPDVAWRAAERKRPGQDRDRRCFLAAFRQG